MSDFVWILDANKDTEFGKRGVSSEYIIPQGDMTRVRPASLAGSRLWVLLDKTDKKLFLSLKIKKVEKMLDDYHKDDFFITVDLLSSFRLASKYRDLDKYITGQIFDREEGISKIKKSISQKFMDIVIESVEKKNIRPKEEMLPKIDTKILPMSDSQLAKAAIRIAVTQFNLNEIWEDGPRKISAFANFAQALIKIKAKKEISKKIEKVTINFDPIFTMISTEKESSQKKYVDTSSYPKVDTELKKIEPDNIYARKFIAAEDRDTNLEARIDRTEHAEEMHQKMLKDIAEFLISKHIIPYESGSIDLVYSSKAKELKMCEIKSATGLNIFSQAAKGSFQLSRYMEEITKIHHEVVPRLILKKIGNEEVEAYIKKILYRMNTIVLYYDINRKWPNKVDGLF